MIKKIKDQRSKIKTTDKKPQNILMFLVCGFGFLFLVFSFLPVFADTGPISGGIVHCVGDPCTLCDLSILADRFTRFLMFNVMLPLAALMILIGGVLILTARDNQQQQTQGKAVFWYAVWGMIIAFAAWLIVSTLLATLGYKGTWYAFPDPASCIPATPESDTTGDGTTGTTEGGINCACTTSVGSDKILASGPFSVTADTNGNGTLDCTDSDQCINCAAVTEGAECVLCTDSGGGLDCGGASTSSPSEDEEDDTSLGPSENNENLPPPEFNFYCSINGTNDFSYSDCDTCTAAGGICEETGSPTEPGTDNTNGNSQTVYYCILEQVDCTARTDCNSCFAAGGICVPNEPPPGC